MVVKTTHGVFLVMRINLSQPETQPVLATLQRVVRPQIHNNGVRMETSTPIEARAGSD